MSGGGKLSPRQRMINMMYLVLIALLALNVSKQVLNSFFLMEKSFIGASKNIDAKNNATMGVFDANMNDEKKKARTQPWFEKAKAVKTLGEKFHKEINELKTHLEELNGGRVPLEEGEKGLTAMLSPDIIEKHAHYFVNEGHGVELQASINKTAADMLNILKPNPADTGKLKSQDYNSGALYKGAVAANQLKAEDPEGNGMSGKTWVTEELEHQPIGAVMANLTRYQNDAKSLEADILDKLVSQIDASTIKFTDLVAKVVPSSNYVMVGEPFKADILLVAYNKASDHDIMVGGRKLTVEDGIGKYTATHSDIGEKSFSGKILVEGPDGVEEHEFTQKYQTFKPVATISADAMNMFYVGLDNPVSVSVPGFPAKNVFATMSGGTMSSKGNGKYMVKVGKGRKATISVTAKTADGKSKSMGSTEFRVKPLPKPVASLGGVDDALPVSRNVLAAQSVVLAKMPAGFAYDLKWRVTGYKFIFQPRRAPAKLLPGSGHALSGQMKGLMSKARKGDRVIIEGIKARESKYGFTKSLKPIVITVR